MMTDDLRELRALGALQPIRKLRSAALRLPVAELILDDGAHGVRRRIVDEQEEVVGVVGLVRQLIFECVIHVEEPGVACQQFVSPARSRRRVDVLVVLIGPDECESTREVVNHVIRGTNERGAQSGHLSALRIRAVLSKRSDRLGDHVFGDVSVKHADLAREQKQPVTLNAGCQHIGIHEHALDCHHEPRLVVQLASEFAKVTSRLGPINRASGFKVLDIAPLQAVVRTHHVGVQNTLPDHLHQGRS